MRASVLAAVAALGLGSLVAAGAAYANPAQYDFYGTGSGSVGGVTFTDQSFNLSLLGDTSNVFLQSPGFYRINNLGGTFTLGVQNFSVLPDVAIVVSNTPLNLINFFNATFDNGLGGNNAGLASYDLTTFIGPIALDPLTPTLNGGTFALAGGQTLQFTDSLTLNFFSDIGPPPATPAPEPSTLALMIPALGFFGVLLARRRKQA